MSEKNGDYPFDQVEDGDISHSPESKLVEQFPQLYVNKLFSEAEKLDPSEFSKTATVDEVKKFIQFFRDSSENFLPALPEDIRNKYLEIITVLETRTRGKDPTTLIRNRDFLNEEIKGAIIEVIAAKTEEEKEKIMRHTGIIEFDVRGLKVVNDANKDHAVGDAFLRRIAKETTLIGREVLSKILGTSTSIELFRDGGDEFCIFIQNSEEDLEAPITIEKIQERFPESVQIDYPDVMDFEDPNNKEKTFPRMRTQTFAVRSMAIEIFHELQSQSPNGEVKFLSVVSKLTQRLLAERTCEDIMKTKTIEKHLKKGVPDYTNPGLENFKLPLLVAAGETSLFNVFRDAKSEYIKRGETVEGLNADKIVTMLMSMVRLCADQGSNEEKERQNARWTNSENPVEKVYADLISRNSVTIELSQKLRELRRKSMDLLEEFNEISRKYALSLTTNFDLGEKNKNLQAMLDTVIKEKEERQGEIERLTIRLAEQSRIIWEQAQTIARQNEELAEIKRKLGEPTPDAT